ANRRLICRLFPARPALRIMIAVRHGRTAWGRNCDGGSFMSLSLAVIIPTYGRKEVLERLLRWLGHQTRLPHEVIISAPDETHVPDVETRFPVRRLYGPPSLTAQRNRALDYALGRFDIIAFLDDDLIPATDYMERVARALEDNPDWAVVMGGIVRDGAS